ncbi:MAG TPA: aromatic ring-hydroxylating dioxygenase subunit alpha [Acidimicrobiales bacterium]
MDDAMITALESRMEAERARTGPPEGFPKLPDLSLDRYTDPDLFEAELSEIFGRAWLFVGLDSEYPEAGSYRVLDLPNAQVIVARGNDGQLRGFLNACRHRGAPVVRDQEGTARLFVCQFHSWSYDLDGNLARVPEEKEFLGLVKEERGLPTVRVEMLGHLVFVNFDHDARSLEEDLGPAVVRRMQDLASADLRVIDRKSHVVDCNWKILAEAFLETYHVKTIHPEAALAVDSPGTVLQLLPNGHNYLAIPYTDIVEQAEFAQMMWPADLPRPEQLRNYGGKQSGFYTFPNSQILGDPSGCPVFSFWPISVGQSRFDVTLYGADWGDGEQSPSWDLKVMQLDILTGQDMMNLEPIQRSIDSAAHYGVPLGYMERGIWHLHAEIDRRLGTERIPESMRVPDLLGDFVED